MPEPWAYHEMAGAILPHERYRSNLAKITESLAAGGGRSYSDACGHAGRQAARRLFRNKKTTPEGLMNGHVQQTAARCTKYPLVLCVQDTTTLDYSRHHSKTDLGPVTTEKWSRGLLCHSVLAVSTEGLPLGVLHLDMWTREETDEPKRNTRRQRETSEKESYKWLLGLRGTAKALPASQPVLMIQDREADVFDLFAAPRRVNMHLLIRACRPRRVEIERDSGTGEYERTTLMNAIKDAPVAGSIVVNAPRKPGQPEREAQLEVQYQKMRVHPPKHDLHCAFR